ncbi:MAG: hypothetical protein K6E54_08670 [Bacteroidaceae bacterium]|nr:hypothetical protein [Bacteroidaceae bacterium]
MNLSTTLKSLAFLLFIEAISQALKHPFYFYFADIYNINAAFASGASWYYNNASVWVQLGLYALFVIYMNQLDSRSPHARFGSAFRFDLYVTIINTLLLIISIPSLVISFSIKIIIEIAGIATALIAGYSIYRDIPTPEMQTVRNSYWILSFRHLIYTIIMIVDIYLILFNDVNPDIFGSKKFTFISWILLMPILLISRFYLFKGIREMDINIKKTKQKQQIEEI